jgi:hypothetical protein
MKLDETALMQQIEQEFEKDWEYAGLFTGFPSKLRDLANKLLKNQYRYFYFKGYSNGWETRALYPKS